MKRIFAIAAALTLLISSSSELQAAIELVKNGGFEAYGGALSGGYYQHVPNQNAGSPPFGIGSPLQDWNTGLGLLAGATGSGVDLVRVVNPGQTLAPAAEGAQFVDLNGSPGPGNIFQVLDTVVGQLYQLTFAHASNQTNSAGLYGVWDGEGSGGTALIALTPFLDGPTSPLVWQYVTATFTAASDKTTIAFGSFIPPVGNHGAMIDAVSVQAVPEPMTALVWGTLGLFGSAAAWRAKNKQLTA